MDKYVKKEFYDEFHKNIGRIIEEISDEEMKAAYSTIEDKSKGMDDE